MIDETILHTLYTHTHTHIYIRAHATARGWTLMISGRHTRAAIIAKFPVYLDAIMSSVERRGDGKKKRLERGAAGKEEKEK